MYASDSEDDRETAPSSGQYPPLSSTGVSEKLKCPFCPEKAFKTSGVLTAHLNFSHPFHDGQKVAYYKEAKCSFCPSKAFQSAASLLSHMISYHPLVDGRRVPEHKVKCLFGRSADFIDGRSLALHLNDFQPYHDRKMVTKINVDCTIIKCHKGNSRDDPQPHVYYCRFCSYTTKSQYN